MLLTDLSADGYRPVAWVRFLSGSLARAGETRRRRPYLARQSRRWGLLGAAASLVAPRLLPLNGLPRVRRRLAWWGLSWLMLDWHLGMVESPNGERRDHLSPADAVTLTRLWLVPLMVSLSARSGAFVALLAVGAASDLADGRLAAHYGATRLGRDLDSTADVAFFGAAAIAAARSGRLNRPASVAVAGRYVVGIGLIALHYFGRNERPSDAALPQARWAAPSLVGGLLLSATGRRSDASALVGASSLAAFACWLARARQVAGGGRRGSRFTLLHSS